MSAPLENTNRVKLKTAAARRRVCRNLLDHLEKGHSIDSFPDLSRNTLQCYIRLFPNDFPSEDIQKALRIARKKDETLCLDALYGRSSKHFNTRAWSLRMKNRWGWRLGGPLENPLPEEPLLHDGQPLKAYTAFRYIHNVADKAEYDPRLPVILAWDFNLLGSCVLLHATSDRLWAFDEVRLVRSWTPALCQEIINRYHLSQFPHTHSLSQIQWTDAHRPASWIIVGDASGHRNTSNSQLSDLDHIRKHFQPLAPDYREHIAPSNPSVKDRLLQVNRLLEASRLQIHPRCQELIQDLENVALLPGDTDLDKRTNPVLTHFSDALGYACLQFPHF